METTTRPSAQDAEILTAVAQNILRAMPKGTIVEGEEDDAIADIIRALREEAPELDEYRLTRRLEEYGWSCDMAIVGAFEIASGDVWQSVREATRIWIRSNGIKPRLTIGAQVKVMARSTTRTKQEFDGEVVAVDADHGTYTVMISALGHVREGAGIHGIIVNFEDLHALATPAEEFQLELSC